MAGRTNIFERDIAINQSIFDTLEMIDAMENSDTIDTSCDKDDDFIEASDKVVPPGYYF